MIGVLFYGVLGLWGFFTYKFSGFLVKKIKQEIVKYCVQGTVFVLMFIAPVADEIIGGIQFRSLCNENAILVVDQAKVKGKTVISQELKRENINNYLLPITTEYFSFKDIDSDEILVSWNVFYAKGGWLSRSLNFFGSTKPYIFDGTCGSPKWKKTIFSDLNVNVIYQKGI
jgi:hypothetical protein